MIYRYVCTISYLRFFRFASASSMLVFVGRLMLKQSCCVAAGMSSLLLFKDLMNNLWEMEG